MLRRLADWLKHFNQLHLVIGLISIAFIGLVYFWKIGHLTAGMSPDEATTLANSHSLHALYQHPLNAPHNFWLYLIQKSGHHPLWLLRSVSAMWALVFGLSFYKVARSWFGSFVGWLSTLMFATTPLVILTARSTSAEVMIFSPLLLTAGYFWISRKQEPSNWEVAAMALLLAVCLYTPGAVWLVIAGIVAVRHSALKLVSNLGSWVWLIVPAFLALLLPLVLRLMHSPSMVLDWLALPHAVHALSMLKAIGWSILGLAWQSAGHNNLQIARQPLAHLAEIILGVLGLSALWQRARLKTYGLLFMIIVGTVLAGLSGNYAQLAISLAAICIFAGAGLRYLHIEWQGVFPRNPIARSFALIVICLTVGFSVVYGVRYSLVAWPNTVATKQIYVLK